MKKPKRILVGLKSLESVQRLVDLACHLGARGASLHLVHVIELPDPTPLDAEVPDLVAAAGKIVAKAKGVARRGRMKTTSLVIRARDAGAALLDEMKGRKIELAVLGYHHRRTLGEIILGTTARHLANKAPCHIVLDIPVRD